MCLERGVQLFTKYVFHVQKVIAVFFSLLILFASYSYAEETLSPEKTYVTEAERLFNRLLAGDFAGEFTQHRTINGLPITLKSSGDFIFSRNLGLYWHTQIPFNQSITFKKDDIILWSEPGVTSVEEDIDLIEKHTSKMLLAFFSADLASIQNQFTSEITESENGAWKVQLLPKTKLIAKVIDAVELQGNDAIEQLKISSANGDVTELLFENLHTVGTLNPNLCQYFYRQINSACGESQVNN